MLIVYLKLSGTIKDEHNNKPYFFCQYFSRYEYLMNLKKPPCQLCGTKGYGNPPLLHPSHRGRGKRNE